MGLNTSVVTKNAKVSAFNANYPVTEKTSDWKTTRALPSTVDLNTLTTTQGVTFQGGVVSWAAHSVSSIDDVNGDGKPEILIGAPLADNGNGRAYLVFGGQTGTINLNTLTESQGVTFQGGVVSWAGFSVSAINDVNGDGKPEVLIGAPYVHFFYQSRAYLVFGGQTGTINLNTLTESQGVTFQGGVNDRGAGVSVSAINDVNGDGKPEVLIGAPYADNYNGSAYLVFGGQTGTINLNTLTASQGVTFKGGVYGWAGWSVSTINDVNGDGKPEVLIGAIKADNYNGSAYLVFGGQTGTINLNTLTASQGVIFKGGVRVSLAGLSVSSINDVNGDGKPEVLIGSPGANSFNGRAYLVFGGQTGTINLNTLTESQGVIFQGGVVGGAGFSVSSINDLNGDGKPEVLIGTPYADYNGVGRAYLVFIEETLTPTPTPSPTPTPTPTPSPTPTPTPIDTASTLSLDVNTLRIKQGKRILITTKQLSASLAGASSDELLFTVRYGGQHSGSIHGYFEHNSNPGKSVSQFTQADIEAEFIYFVHNGGENPPNYAINVCHGDSSLPVEIKFTFDDRRREVKEMQMHYLTQADLKDMEEGKTTDTLSDYWVDEVNLEVMLQTYHISPYDLIEIAYKKEGGNDEKMLSTKEPTVKPEVVYTSPLNAEEKAPEKKAEALTAGVIYYHDETVSHKGVTSGDLKIQNHKIEMKQGGKHRVRTSELSATIGGVKDNNLIFMIANNYRRHEHSYFKTIVQPGEVRQFTQGDVEAGKIYFVHDKTDDKPSYSVSVSEGECTIPETVVVDFYNKHGKLIYSGRPSGASELRSDEGLVATKESEAVDVAIEPKTLLSNNEVLTTRHVMQTQRNQVAMDDVIEEVLQVSCSAGRPRSWLNSAYEGARWLGSFWISGYTKKANPILPSLDLLTKEKQLNKAEKQLGDLKEQLLFGTHAEETRLSKAIRFYQEKIAVWREDMSQFTAKDSDDLAHDLKKLEEKVTDNLFSYHSINSVKTTERLGFFNATNTLAMAGGLATPAIAAQPSMLRLK